MNGEWQPIETAPRTGRRVLLLMSSGDHVCGHWNDWDDDEGKPLSPPHWLTDWDLARGVMSKMARHFTPTHWMPLPEPPKEGAK